jgi:hypothetical protein
MPYKTKSWLTPRQSLVLATPNISASWYCGETANGVIDFPSDYARGGHFRENQAQEDGQVSQLRLLSFLTKWCSYSGLVTMHMVVLVLYQGSLCSVIKHSVGPGWMADSMRVDHGTNLEQCAEPTPSVTPSTIPSFRNFIMHQESSWKRYHSSVGLSGIDPIRQWYTNCSLKGKFEDVHHLGSPC